MLQDLARLAAKGFEVEIAAPGGRNSHPLPLPRPNELEYAAGIDWPVINFGLAIRVVRSLQCTLPATPLIHPNRVTDRLSLFISGLWDLSNPYFQVPIHFNLLYTATLPSQHGSLRDFPSGYPRARGPRP